MTLSQQNVLGAGAAAATLTAVALAAANFAGDGGNGGVGPYAITLDASLAVAVVLFGWAIPRIDRPARAGLIVGVLGVLSIAAFWSGLPYVLGPAAIVLGLLGRARTKSGTENGWKTPPVATGSSRSAPGHTFGSRTHATRSASGGGHCRLPVCGTSPKNTKSLPACSVLAPRSTPSAPHAPVRLTCGLAPSMPGGTPSG